MSVRLGKNIAFISAAALLLAACSTKDPEYVNTDTNSVDTGTEAGSSNNGNNGQPNAIETPVVESNPLYNPTPEGFTDYSGADRVLFAYDSSDLSAASRAILGKQAEWLNHNRAARVTIEGHCDERGTREYNLALGDRRATAVKNYLVALGVSATRMNTISYGKERPASAGNFAQNRRGVVVLK